MSAAHSEKVGEQFAKGRRPRHENGTADNADGGERKQKHTPPLPLDVSGLNLPTLNDIRHKDIPPKVPVIRDLLFPGAWLLVGRPKIGKSWLLLQMVMAVSEGMSFLGFSTGDGAEVLYVAGEDDDGRIRSRLEQMGVCNAPPNAVVINQQDLRRLAQQYKKTATFPQFLDRYLEVHPAVRLVVVDTETTVRQVWTGEAGPNGSLQVTLTDYLQTREFDEIALRRGVVVILVNHARKNDGKWVDIHELINRSNTALAGASGSMVLADPPDADQLNTKVTKRVFGVRGRDLRDDVLLAVEQREETATFVSLGEYMEVSQTEAEEEVLCALEDLMIDCKPDEYVTTADIAEHMGKQRGTVKRTLSRLLKKPHGAHWKKFTLVSRAGKKGGVRLDPR